MIFRIALNPLAAPEYFTVSDHRRALLRASDTNRPDVVHLQTQLRKLLQMPEHFRLFLLDPALLHKILEKYRFVTKDDPATGIDLLRDHQKSGENPLLDLSFSFPQLPLAYSDLEMVIIHPPYSLGIPTEISLLFIDQDVIMDILPLLSGAEYDENELLLIEKVVDDYCGKGMGMLRRESNYKAALLYQTIEDCSFLEPCVGEKLRSKTVVQAYIDPPILPRIKKLGFEVGVQMVQQNTVISIANYPTHSKELMELLADKLLMF